MTALHVYPVKSCGGTTLELAEVGDRGFVGDREFMIVDSATGRFLTQREHHPLALVRPTLTEAMLRLTAPGMSDLDLITRESGPDRTIVIWRDVCEAVDQGDAAAEWLSDYIGVACRLVRIARQHDRQVDLAYARPGDRVGFADGFPFLVISEESLADLNRRLPQPLPMNRFRPNIVVAGGGAPYLEDHWRKIRISDIVLHLVKECARCVTTTVDQDSAAAGAEPLRTLATYRRADRGVMFGQNAIHDGRGTVRVGVTVEVLE